MKTYIVQLETHDDIISAQDKISWSKARRVLLVWPRRGKVLQRQVDLLLLLRHAQKLGAQIAVITNSGMVKTHARELGIPVFRNTAQAQKSNWLRLHTRRRLPIGPRTPADPVVLRQQRETLQLKPRENRWLQMGAFVAGIFAFLILVLFFAPGAAVELNPAQKIQSLTIAVWASPEIRTANPSGGLPARPVSVEVEGRDQVNSTGEVWIADKTAQGKIVLTNLTDQAVDVPAGSVVMTTQEPVARFITLEAASLLPGVGEQQTVGIQAVTPGLIGNVSAGSIQALEGQAGLRLAVSNPEATSGGSDRRGPAPNAGDARRLREKLLADLKITALEEIQGRLQSEQRLLVNSLRVKEIIEETREPQENIPADMLQLTMRVEFEAWIIDAADLQLVAQAALNATLEKGFQPMPDSLRYTFTAEPTLEETAGSTESFTARGALKIDQIVEAVVIKDKTVEAIRGQTVADAQRILQSQILLADPPNIQMYPEWWSRLPFLPFRIVVVKQ
jgi:hypothetical protein